LAAEINGRNKISFIKSKQRAVNLAAEINGRNKISFIQSKQVDNSRWELY